MARAATSDELTKLRTSGQRSRLYLAIHKPATVYTARVNQASFVDPVGQIAYDMGSGTLADVLPGMTMYVGSTAGAYDIGMVRIRKTPTASAFYIGLTSEIAWADNLYLTVVDEFGLWPRIPVDIGSDLLMDADTAYSDQHTNFEPVPVLGPLAAALWLTGATVYFSPDASGSWAPGSTISAYLWSAPGASATLNMTTATPTITYNAAGTYRVSCQVTAANGKTATGYRYVFVFDAAHMPATQFDLERCGGDWQSGGWSFEVKMSGEADLTAVRERALVVLLAEDWYGSSQASLGPISGYENVIAAGWIAGETIEWDPQAGAVQFRVDGPAAWLEKVAGTPISLNWRASGSATWSECDGLTIDRALYHALRWRSTATVCMDARLPGSTKLITNVDTGGAGLYAQLEDLARWLLARPLCDRYGRLIIETDTQMLETAARSGIPTVMEITTGDWEGELEIERNPVRGVAAVELAAYYFNGSSEGSLYSRAPGLASGRFGTIESRERALVNDQDECNALSGLALAEENNPLPYVGIDLAQNNRMIDIAPRQYVTLSASAADTRRGITLSAQKLIPRRIEISYQAKTGALRTRVECEAETSGPPGVTVIQPDPGIIGNAEFEFPDYNIEDAWPSLVPSGITFPSTLPGRSPIPPGTGDCPTDAPANGPYNWGVSGTLISNNRYRTTIRVNTIIRSSSHTNKTTYAIQGTWLKRNPTSGAWEETSQDDQYEVYALDAGGNIVATGVHDPVTSLRYRTGQFLPPAAVEARYIRIELDADLFHPDTIYQVVHNPHPWNSSTPGTFSHGPLGAGYQAKVEGALISGTAVWDGWLSINFTGPNDYYGKIFEVEQTVYGVFLQYGTHRISSVFGRLYEDVINWQTLWTENVANVLWVARAKSFTATQIYPAAIGNPGFAVYFRCNLWNTQYAVLMMNNYWVARLQASYQATLQNFQLWNVCAKAS